MRRGGGGSAADVRTAAEGVGDGCYKDNNRDKDIDVVDVVGQSPKKRQRPGSLFPTPEARRGAKDVRRRGRGAKPYEEGERQESGISGGGGIDGIGGDDRGEDCHCY